MWSYSPLQNWSLRGSLMFLSTFSLILCLTLNGIVMSLMYLLGYNGTNSTTFSDSSTPMYNILLSMVVIGFAGAFVCIFGIWAAKRVRYRTKPPVQSVLKRVNPSPITLFNTTNTVFTYRLHSIVVFFWMCALLIGCFFIFGVITFDFQSNVRNFITQHWSQSKMGIAREIGCQKGTADTLCSVPTIGYPYASQDEWCSNTYQSTECASIQADAIDVVYDQVMTLMNVSGALLVLLVVDMVLAMFISVKLVAMPIIMLSMQAVSSYLLIVPAAAMIFTGHLLVAMQNFYDEHYWVKYLCFTISALLLCCAIFGAISGHIRHTLMLKVYIGCLVVALLIICSVLVIVIYGMLQFLLIFDGQPEQETWEDSCKSDLYNCCCCETDETTEGLYPPPACPEWTNDNVSDLCRAFLTLVALSTSLCMAFVVWCIVVATLLYRNLKVYRAEYV